MPKKIKIQLLIGFLLLICGIYLVTLGSMGHAVYFVGGRIIFVIGLFVSVYGIILLWGSDDDK